MYKLLIFCGLFTFSFCKKPTVVNVPVVADSTVFYKGADISWVTEMETNGIKFYNKNNEPKDCFELLKSNGVNAIRLRVWVNPLNEWNNENDVLAKAKRANDLGLNLMIDFHYSDSWADPGQQTKPTAWASQNFNNLKTTLYNHTYQVLNKLKTNGIKPKWVQIGNETNNGMLWPDGRASTSMNNFAQLVNVGYDAIKAVDSSIKAIVHLSNGYDKNLYQWMFDGLLNNGARFDIIGMSVYPSPTNWQALNDQCVTNMQYCINNYNKEILITEVGMSWDNATECKAFLTDLMTKSKAIANKKVLGVFYWEPQAYNNWQGYTLGAFDNAGKPTIALDAFK